ncbi:amidohydrolase [Nocardia sp. NPDC051911]|uniref:amidohydrolase n=1 Tax=Nocardia sp. NPDC051911 TaxID=3154648 RepID=UPI00342B7CCE
MWTDRDSHGEPTAIAMGNGRIVAVGDDLEQYVGPDTRVVDVGGRRVIPGLVDSHLHAVRAGWSYLDELDLTETRSLAELLEAVADATAGRASGSWITALGGWHPSQLAEGRMPSRSELDEAAPHHPVFVHPVYGHDDHGVLNSVALEEMGWIGPCPDPEAGVLHRSADGSPDGRISGVSAYQAVVGRALRPPLERSEASTEAFFTRLAAVGLTGVVDAGGLGMVPEKYQALHAVWRRGRLPIRVRTFLGAVTGGHENEEIAGWQRYLAPGLGDDLLAVAGVGEAMHYGCHDWEGMNPLDAPDWAYTELGRSLLETARRGWPMTIHAILDESITRILDAIEMVAAEVPIAQLRWSLCHVECISRTNLERVRDLGLGLTLQSRVSHKGAVCAERWGEETFRHAPPLGDMLDLGIPFGAGTDGTRAASYNPWQALWWFVTGRCLDGGPRRDGRHRIDRAAALDAYTRGSTWFTFEENRRGRLLPGFDADLAVLSEDYFTVPEDEIPAIESELTIVSGRIVHAGRAFPEIGTEHHSPRPASEAAGQNERLA